MDNQLGDSLDTMNETVSYQTIDNMMTKKIAKINTGSISTEYQSDSGELWKTQRTDDLSDNSQKSTISNSLYDDNDGEFVNYPEILSVLQSWSSRLGRNAEMCNSMNEIFIDLCKIEYQYVESLRNLKDKINLKRILECTEGLSTVSILSAFKSYLTKMAENHAEFVDSISNECFFEQNKEHGIRDVVVEIELLKKEVDKYKSDKVLCFSKMKESYFNAKNAVTLCLDATHQAPSIKTSVHKTVIPIILNFININNMVYKYDEYNHVVEFNNKIQSLVNSLNELEKTRCIQINDVVSRFMVCEMAKLRNLEYDLNSLIETLNNFGSKDLENTFRGENLNRNMPQIQDNCKTKYSEFSTKTNKVTSFLFPSTIIRPPPYRVISKVENDIQRFLECVWGTSETLELNDFKDEIQSSLVRQVFCDLLSKNISTHSQIKSKDQFQYLVEMVNSILSVSERQADYWCGYSILKFSDKYHLCDEDGKCYLWSRICSNNYWKSRVFWEECLTIILSLDLKAIFETSSCLEKTLTLINCVPSTDEPHGFCDWMTKYGFEDKECKKLIHEVFMKFKVPESYFNSLIVNEL
uniref:Myotubularin protein, putative n=1 Tax=Theileria annulata TaxID=5874 RepID=A0A3B0MZ63_THEAN